MKWSNHFVSWVDDLPIPAWVFYLVLFLLIGMLITIALWLSGNLPVWEFNLVAFFLGTWTVEALILTHINIHAAMKALGEFKPILDIEENEFEMLSRDFLQLPIGGGMIAIALTLSATALDSIPIVGTALSYILPFVVAFVAGAAIVVALKEIFQTARN